MKLPCSIWCFLVMNLFVQSLEAYILFEDDFESYSSSLGQPWTATGGLESLSAVNSPIEMSSGSQSVTLTDESTSTNGKLHYEFSSPQTGPIKISFDFVSNNPKGYLTFVIYGQEGATRAAYLNLNQHWASPPYAKNKLSGSEQTVATLVQGDGTQWYRVEVETSATNDGGIETWNLEVFKWENNALTSIGSLADAEMRNDAGPAYTGIEFINNSTTDSTQSYTIDNVKIEALPLVESVLELHVSPTGYYDLNGTPTSALTSLYQARQAIRDARDQGSTDSALVWVHEGDYIYTSAGISFNDLDGDTLYSAVPGEEAPRIVGGKIVNYTSFAAIDSSSPAWSRLPSSARSNVLELDLLALGLTTTDLGVLKDRGFDKSWDQPAQMELFVDTRALTLARYPNGNGISGMSVVSAIDDHTFTYWSGGPQATWSEPEKVWFHGLWGNDFADGVRKAISINTSTSTVTLTSEPVDSYGIVAGQPYYAFNILEELNSPGEYYIDRDTGFLYVWPDTTWDGNTRIILSMHPNGTLVSIADAHNLRFEGFVFEGSRSQMVEVTGTSSNVVFKNCTLMNGGQAGISISTEFNPSDPTGPEGKNNGLIGCTLMNLASYGVNLQGGDTKDFDIPAGNFVQESVIHNVGRLNRTYRPAIQTYGVGQIVTDNEIFDLPHTGILVKSSESLIAYNRIHDVNYTAGDMGAIYGGRSWVRRGNKINYNYIHDIQSNREKSVGIYLDDVLSGQEVVGNFIRNVGTPGAGTSHGRGLFNNGGRDNIFKNNVVIDCDVGHRNSDVGLIRIIDDTFLQQMLAVDYQGAAWSAQYPDLAVIPNVYANWTNAIKSPQGTVFTNNVLWNNDDDYMAQAYGGTPDPFDWYASYGDNLENTDPEFVDPDSGDYSLEPTSDAFDLPEFVALPLREMGVSELIIENHLAPDDGITGQLGVSASYAVSSHLTPTTAGVTLFYGPSDGGTNPSLWAHSSTTSTIEDRGSLTVAISLDPGVQYAGRWRIENTEAGTVWTEVFHIENFYD